jgi:hypothetical protein
MVKPGIRMITALAEVIQFTTHITDIGGVAPTVAPPIVPAIKLEKVLHRYMRSFQNKLCADRQEQQG